MATGSLLGVVAGEETAVATLTVVAAVAAMAAVAAVAGDGTRITTDEGDRHEGEKHRNCNTEKTLHHIPPVREPNASCVPSSRHETTPIRDGYRTAADEFLADTRGRKLPDNRLHPVEKDADWRKIAT